MIAEMRACPRAYGDKCDPVESTKTGGSHTFTLYLKVGADELGRCNCVVAAFGCIRAGSCNFFAADPATANASHSGACSRIGAERAEGDCFHAEGRRFPSYR